jgi:DNA ligase-1
MTPRIQFRIFDIVPDKTDQPWEYKLRYECAKSIVENINNPLIKLVPNTPILGGPKEVDKHLKNYLNQGYEGLMLRHALSPYVRGQRSPDLFKYKKFKESEYLVQGVEADKDGNGILVCDGFKVRMKGTDAERRHQIDHPNEYIGKLVTVRYFTLTEFGQPQFPIGITIREDL